MAGYEQIIDSFRGVVNVALESVETGKETRKHATALKSAADAIRAYPESQETSDVLARLTTWSDDLANLSGSETEETAKLRNRVKGLVDAEIMDDDKEAVQLLEWYAKAVKPTGASSGDRNVGVTTPDFQFAIKAICPDHGDVVMEGQRTGHAYWNSLRHSCRKHEKSQHGEIDLTDPEGWKKARSAIADGTEEVSAGRFTLKAIK